MSTPPKPDDSADGAATGTAGGDGVDARTTAVDARTTATGPADAAPSAESGGSGSGPGATSGSGASGGTPPPWQRGGGAAPSPGPSAPSGGQGGGQNAGQGGGQAGGRPAAGPATGATPAQAPAQAPAQTPQRPGGPPSGPMPTARGGPQGGGAPGGGASGGRGPAGAAASSAAASTAAGSSASEGAGQRSGEGSGTPAAGQRSSTALIDAPTNQLSPEQLGMRGGSGRRPNGQDDEDDVADLTAARPSRNKNPRRASLQVKRFDPWSVLKLALVLGVALFFVWMFAVGVLYAVLDGMGVWAQLNGTYQDLTSDSGGGGQLITAGGVFGVAAIVGVINTILFTALASVSAFIYNISADVAGGIEVTLSERD